MSCLWLCEISRSPISSECIKAAWTVPVTGTSAYVVTIESIVPNLGLLREYKPMIKEFWRERAVRRPGQAVLQAR